MKMAYKTMKMADIYIFDPSSRRQESKYAF
jgi:hypothetical protein